MKKIIYIIGFIAASAFAFSSCQKEFATDNNQPEKKLVTITFSAEKAGTKTAAVEGTDEVSFVWTNDDVNNMKLFTVGSQINEQTGNEEEVLTQITSPTITKESDTQLTISAEVEANTTYTFRAILSGDWTGSGNDYGKRSAKVKVSQNPNGISNFDPTADILVSDDMEVIVGASETEVDGLLMTFRRKVVVNKMTLKNLGAGEKVSKVVVTSSTSDIQGYVKGGELFGQSKEITLNYNNETVPSDGQFPVYFTSIPAEGVSLTVAVTTDQNTYSKSFAAGKSVDFNLGQFTSFGISMPAGSPVVEIADGNYFITGIKESSAYAASAYVSGNNLPAFAITLDTANESIAFVKDIEDCIFTLTRIVSGDYEGKYTIQDVNGLYLYAAGGNSASPSNHLKGEATPDSNGNAYWTIEKNANGTYSVESAGDAARKIMRFNPESYIFSCYASGQNEITLYPASWCVLDTTPIITIEETSKNVLSSATSVSFTYDANRYASAPTVVVASDTDGIINGTPSVADGLITIALNPNSASTAKTATLTVTGTGLVGSPVTLTINQAAYEILVAGNETFNLGTESYSIANGNIITWSGTSVTISNAKGTGTAPNNYIPPTRTSTRFYGGNNLTISPAAGYIITSVVFTATSDSYATAFSTSTWTNATAAVNGATVTVTPTDGTAVISAIIGGTCGFTSIKVNYLTASSGEEDTPTATFDFSSSFTSTSGTINGVTLTTAKNNGTNEPAYNSNSGQLRIYRYGSLTLSSSTNITSIVISYDGTNVGSDTAANVGTYSCDDSIGTWTGSAKSVTITNTGTTNVQMRITSIKVYCD